MAEFEIRESLRKLAARPDDLNGFRLWRAMLREERQRSLSVLLAGGQGSQNPSRVKLVILVARELKFREQTVLKWDDAKLTAAASRCRLDSSELIGDAIKELHVADRRPLMGAFYTLLGLPHDDGVFNEDEWQVPAAPALQTTRAADTLLQQYPPDEVVTFAIAMSVYFPALFPALREWLPDVARRDARVDVPVGLSLETQAQPPIPRAPTDLFGFTTLDRRLIVAILNTATGVTGSANEEEIDDLLDEVLQLNIGRHQTYFHFGYRDALFGRTLGEDIAGQNAERRAWYWAGAATVMARGSKWTDIASAFDQPMGMREIGTATNGAERAGAYLVFRALVEVGRVGEATSFLNASAVAKSSKLRQELLATATRLIRESRASEARPLLELTWKACEEARDNGEEIGTAFFRELRRRRALCFRQLGETEAARELLDELAKESDPVVRAVALTDLGLLAASVRRLGEIMLPANKADLPNFVAGLRLGERLFLEAASTSGFRPAHAQFVLGTIDFVTGQFASAVRRFDEALTVFNGAPDVYGRDRTLQLAKLYLGLSICHAMEDGGGLPRARDAIEQALASGARVPVWLIADTIDALAVARTDIAEEVAGIILQHTPEGLDEVLRTSAVGAPGVALALSKRAGEPSRSSHMRAQDYRQVLPMHLARQDMDRARDALAFLEEAAAQGIGREELRDLLASEANYSPAWTSERAIEARVYLLEAEGRFAEAAVILETACYPMLAGGEPYVIDDADLVCAHIESYGPQGAEAAGRLRPRIESMRRQCIIDEPVTPVPHDIALRILVVGGNETQARMDDDIRTDIFGEYPRITLDFLHTGWSGNWSHFSDEFDRRAKNADGVVFLSLMRTMLGRRLRQHCHVPRGGCGRGGKGAIAESIRRLIPMVLAHNERRRQQMEQIA